MLVTCVHVVVKPEHIDAFIAATTRNHEASVQEAGNRRFDVLQSVDDPCRFVLYEAYDTAEAAASHKQTPTTSPGATAWPTGWPSPAKGFPTVPSPPEAPAAPRR
jgi:autoinducer 2-degrading protein